MELKLNFRNDNIKGTDIPIDYQYFVASWIYSIISKGDAEYARFLHNEGYRSQSHEGLEKPNALISNKVFKLFCFSHLQIETYRIDKQTQSLKILSDLFYLNVRFMVNQALENFVKGLFMNEVLRIKNGFNQMAAFEIVSVESSHVEVNSTSVKIKTLSPLVVSQLREDKSTAYLSPSDERFEALFFNNLLAKLNSTSIVVPPNDAETEKRSLKILTDPKSKLISISKGNQRAIKVKGFMFEFEIQAPKYLIELGLLSGFGVDNSMGFGFGEVIGY